MGADSLESAPLLGVFGGIVTPLCKRFLRSFFLKKATLGAAAPSNVGESLKSGRGIDFW